MLGGLCSLEREAMRCRSPFVLENDIRLSADWSLCHKHLAAGKDVVRGTVAACKKCREEQRESSVAVTIGIHAYRKPNGRQGLGVHFVFYAPGRVEEHSWEIKLLIGPIDYP